MNKAMTSLGHLTPEGDPLTPIFVKWLNESIEETRVRYLGTKGARGLS